MPTLTPKKATARTPQIVTIIVDDSNSMQGMAQPGKSKCAVATDSIQDMIITTQANTQVSRGFRFLLNLAKFGDTVIPIAEAKRPGDVNLDSVKFEGKSGWTNMAVALEWGHDALLKALEVCRKIATYDEATSPPPLVVFLSDGENTGPDPTAAAEKLKSIPFLGGSVNVVACGIGLRTEHFAMMQTIASSPELAMNIQPARLAEFIAAVGATMQVGNLNAVRVLGGGQQPTPGPRPSTFEPVPPQPQPEPVPPQPQPEPVTPQPPQPPEPPIPTERPSSASMPASPTSAIVETEPPPNLVERATHAQGEPEPPSVSRLDSEGDAWDAQMATGKTALSAGRLDEAEQALLSALGQVHEPAGGRLVETLSSLATLYASRGQSEEALRYCKQALDLLARLGRSTALDDGMQAAQRVAELLTLEREQEEADGLWMRIAGVVESPVGAGLARDSGVLTALGMHQRMLGDLDRASRLLEQAATAGGPGALAALRALADINLETGGREAAEPYLEKLATQLAAAYGAAHPLCAGVVEELRMSYVQGGKHTKARQLDRQFRKV